MKRLILVWTLALAIASCNSSAPPNSEKTSSMSPSEFYQTKFFKEVQLKSVFPDGKTFVDCVPKQNFAKILELYEAESKKEGFDLAEFTTRHFEEPESIASDFESDTSQSMAGHINRLWPVLTRSSDKEVENSSLISLPYSYVVPGGRFREIYYWDSYFTIEGLLASKQDEISNNMLDNFSYLIDSLGFIPNGNQSLLFGAFATAILFADCGSSGL